MNVKYAENYVFSSSASTCEMLTCCPFCPVKSCFLKAGILVAFEFENIFLGIGNLQTLVIKTQNRNVSSLLINLIFRNVSPVTPPSPST